ncbi:SDR family oxidoreductase [Pedobacter sp. L105]|uniref:SDR family oxidoreductase n=1 Tax=Pedobacter sp. L105 TaxID=1641871 RepID=UPI00131B0503|nr:SDR family oxidoreductase [Pedobacter sp. L105]
MENNIKGKVVIITGASSGIGEAVAKHLASLGAILSLGARRKEKLDELVKDIKAAGGQAQAFVTDVTKREEVEALVKSTVSAFGKVDVLFNNAGLMPLSKLEELHHEEWEQMIDTNLKGTLYGIGAVLPLFKAQKGGHVINVSSVAGHRVGPGGAVYSATKFAVRALSEGFRQEVKPYNIRTTIISPGAIKTELPNTITDTQIKESMKTVLDKAISPESIARGVAYAIEQPADYDVNEIILRPTSQPS